MDWGVLSWIEFINLLPVYLGAGVSVLLLGLAYKQIKSARDDAARRAAFDFCFNIFRSERHIKCKNALMVIKRNFPDATKLYDSPLENKREIETLFEYLDFQEMFSVGVLNQGISEKYAKEVFELIICGQWKYLEDFVNETRIRDKQPSTYAHFEQLALRWSASNINTGRNN